MQHQPHQAEQDSNAIEPVKVEPKISFDLKVIRRDGTIEEIKDCNVEKLDAFKQMVRELWETTKQKLPWSG